MTTTDHTKMLNQIKNKPGKMKKYQKNNVPKARTFGAATKKCLYCGQTHAHVSKYGINLCRCCFRDYALELGFRQYR